MIRSMTGYGQGVVADAPWTVTVEVKCVNHRYSDYNIRLPRDLGRYEEPVRRLLQRSIRRGRVDVLVTVEAAPEDVREVSVNTGLAQGYLKALEKLREAVEVSDPIRLEHFLRLPDVLSVDEGTRESGALGDLIQEACTQALEAVVRMRDAEGLALGTDMRARLQRLAEVRRDIAARAGALVPLWRDKLQARLADLLAPGVIDQERLAQEVAIYADRADITEELVRLDSHLQRMYAALESPDAEPVGRRLDFICQEVLREVNTIGSKALDGEVSGLVITAKEELERIREQLQNIE